MNRSFKRLFACILAVIMLVSGMPLPGLSGIDLSDSFSLKAQAAGVSGYSAGAAAEYAKMWWNGRNTAIWSDYDLWGGDCANFVCQALYAGGIPMTPNWYFHMRIGRNERALTTERTESFTMVNGLNGYTTQANRSLYRYLLSIGGQEIVYPGAWQVSLGDVMLYDWNNDGRYDHCAICTDIINGTPQIACHYSNRLTTDWTLGAAKYAVVKLYGATCSNSTPGYSVYMVTTSSGVDLRYSPGGSRVPGPITARKNYIIHVTQTQWSGSYLYGKCKVKGQEGWVRLSGCVSHITDVAPISVGHAMGDWYVSKNATCTTAGEKRQDCRKCGYSITQPIPCTGHRAVSKATCLSPSICMACRRMLAAPLGHNYGDWVTVQNATCTGNGTQVAKCSRCNQTKSRSNPTATGHRFGAWFVVTEATCVTLGQKKRVCSVCKFEETAVIDYAKHTYGDPIVVREAGCKTFGIKQRTCTVCGVVSKYSSFPLGHSFGDWYIETPATDNSLAVERCDCIRCDAFKRRYVEEHEHQYGDWTVLSTPSCTENGEKYRICSICQYKDIEMQTATGHIVNLIEFGSYPQSRVEDSALIEELNACVKESDLISYGYYYGEGSEGTMQPTDYMQYADVEYNGEKYRYVKIVQARPYQTFDSYQSSTTSAGGTTNTYYSLFSYQRFNGYYPEKLICKSGLTTLVGWTNDQSYWFKYDPIQWRVLDQDTGLVLCNTIIDAQPYCETIYKNLEQELDTEFYGDSDYTYFTTNYAQSSIRKWLNEDFYNTAFTDAEKERIKISEIDNNSASSYGCETTYDKIFIPSLDDVTSTDYYFDYSGENDASRVSLSSDYAQCQGVPNSTTANPYVITVGGMTMTVCSYEPLDSKILNRWWLRTVYDDSSEFAKTVDANGNVTDSNEYSHESVVNQGVGVRPAMRIDGLEILREDVNPTCTQAGSVGDEFCYKCGEQLSEGYNIEMLGHNYVLNETIEPTCLEDGYSVYQCSRCGIEEIHDVVTALGHNMGEWYTVTEATCIDEGVEERECLRTGCDYNEENTTPKSEHISVDDKGYAPTCMLPGLTDGTHCEYCLTVLIAQEELPALGHDESNAIWTCTNEGYENFFGHSKAACDAVTLTCGQSLHFEARCSRENNGEVCGELLDEYDRTAPDCDFVKIEEVVSTCTINGYAVYQCSVCQKEYVEYFETLGHIEGETVTVAPTCTEDGNSYWICQRNGCLENYSDGTIGPHIETFDPVDAVGHSLTPLDDGYDTSDDKAELISSVANACGSGTVNTYQCTHIWNDERCDYTMVIGEASEHEMGDWYVEKPATCEEPGMKRRDCIKNNDYSEWEVMPPIGHDYQPNSTVDPTCEENGYTHYVCANDADHTYDGDYVPEIGHAYDDWETVTPATCEEVGEARRVCAIDATHVETKSLPAIGHVWDEGVINPVSTCKEHGAITYTCKNDSSHTYTELVPLDPDNHDGGTYIKNDKAATCTENGYNGDTYCVGCDSKLSDGEIIPATDHDWGDWETVTPATCEEGGAEKRVCANDTSHVDIRELPLLGHDWDEGVINPVSTCKDHGTITYTCKYNSSHTYTELVPLDPDNHDGGTYIKDEKAATCTEDGYTGDTYCAGCDVKLSDGEVIPATDHAYGEWETVTPATCEEVGAEKRVCANDVSHIETREIPALGHDWDEGVINPVSTCKDHGTITYICKYNSSHTYTELVSLDPDNHDGGTYIKDDKIATCTENGYTGETYCTGCDGKLSDGEVIPAMDHDWGDWETVTPATCEEAGAEKRVCANDASHVEIRELPVFGHDWTGEWVVTKEATIYEKGQETLVCKNNSEHTKTRDIEKLVSYVATFVVDGKTVEEIRFTPGTKHITEPDLKPYDKDNYTVDWEEYDLNDEDIVIHAVYTPIDPDDLSDIKPDKTVDQFENGIATILLSASATSRTVRFVSRSNATPLDVVLVLDRSGSMNDSLGDGKKIDKLKECAISYLEKLNANAVETGADHRVALVGFGSGSTGVASSGKTYALNYEGTGILVTNSSGEISYRDIENGKWNDWNDTLMPVGDILGVNSKLTDAISGITPNGATQTDLGLKMAEKIFASYDNTADRDRLVILITDGDPTSYDTNKTAISMVAPVAVTTAENLKASGVSIYTVGVKEDADPQKPFDSTSDGITVSSKGTSFDFNRFLNIASSNYPGAKSMSNYGEKANDGYYIGVRDSGLLEKSLSKIFVTTVEKPVTFKHATLVDTLSKDFTLTLEQEAQMRERLKEQYGIDDKDISVSRNSDGTTTLRFENIPAVKNIKDGKIEYVANVTFDCSLNKYEAGEYETNTDDAFIEIDGENVAGFEKPEKITVSSDRNIVVFTINGEVYRIWEGNLGDKVNVPETELAKWNIDETVTGNYMVYEADEINTDEYTVTWVVNGKETEETYAFGTKIVAPIPTGTDELEFKGWSPAVPNIMPTENLRFTAVFGPKHVHSFKQSYVYGNCEDGLTVVEKCSCGEKTEEKLAPREHTFTCIVNSYSDNKVYETVCCDVCMHTEEHTLTFSVAKTKKGTSTAIDFTLSKDGVVVQPNDNGVKIMIPLSYLNLSSANNVLVKRLNENGTEKSCKVTEENGYLVFYADHFSIYVISQLNESEEPIEPVEYEDAVCLINGHEYTDYVAGKWPTCTEDGYEISTCTACGDEQTRVIEKLGHSDVDGDEVCDRCNENLNPTDPSANCTHICHKGGFASFIWKIIRAFLKLFKISPVCSCGVAHY